MTPLLSDDRALQILLVEDNPGDARLVEAHLREGLDAAFELWTARRLEEGLRHLQERTVDLVLLDLNLPDASGLDTVRRFRSADGEEPVVVLTGVDDEKIALEALREGVQDYLAKDRIDPDVLRRSVRYSVERHRTARQLERAREERSRLTAILEATPDFVGLADLDGRIEWVNGPGKELIGVPPDETMGGTPVERLHPEWARSTIQNEALPQALEEGLWQGETALLVRGGGEIPVSQIVLAHPDETGDPRYLSTVMRDVSEARDREEQLRRSEERLGRVLETMVEGLCITDADGTVLFANEGAERILDVPVEELTGRQISDEALSGGRWRRHEPDGSRRDEEEFAVYRALTSGEPVHGVEHVLKRPDEEPKTISVNAAPLGGPDGQTEGAVLSLRDVTQQRHLEQELERKALYDQLTGLPNRTLFFDRLEQASARTARDDVPFAVLFIDLDRFKAVNDSLGHGTGDHVLRRIADRIAGCFREEDTVARIGGDEFAVLLEGFDDPGQVEGAVDRLLEALEPPHRLQGETFRVPASVGVAFGEGDVEPDQLVRRADNAMYRAKSQGGAGCRRYDPAEDAGDARRLHLRARLSEAIRNQEFVLHYHPIVEMPAGEIRGVEALVRWDHPDRGLLMPGEFIDLAEETGLIVELGEDLIWEACRSAARWQGEGAGLPLFLNLSARQFEWKGLNPTVSEALQETGFPASRLYFEVTERLAMESSERIAACKELGVGLFIDDFGTGYSSLAYLRDLPVDGLKVDRSFTAGLARDTGGDDLVRALLGLGRALDLTVVAEGIERQEQQERLVELGCRLGQGFHFADPMPADEMSRWLGERGS